MRRGPALVLAFTIAGTSRPATASLSGATAEPGATSTTAQPEPVAAAPAARPPTTPPARATVEPAPSKLVIGGSLGLNLGLYIAPSLETSLFLGGALPGVRTPGGWLALGYQGSASVGRADWIPLRATNGLYSGDYFRGIFVHRHHLALQGAGGAAGRLAYGAGFGLVHAGIRGVGLEGDGRLGYVFTRGDSRLQGSLGGQLRITGVFGEPPQPQLGLFFALTRAPVASIAMQPGAPRRGVALMIVGGLLLAGTALAGGSMKLAEDVSCREGDCEGGFGVLILAPVLAATGIAGLTCLAVGGVRHERYRQWRAQQARLELRGAGLAF